MKPRRPLVGWLLIAPSLIGVPAFLLLPVILAFVVSLFRWDLLGTREFTGLDNYTTLITGGALTNSLLVTAIFTLISVPVSLALGLGLATQLVRAVPGSALVRVVVVIPWVSAPLALGVVEVDLPALGRRVEPGAGREDRVADRPVAGPAGGGLRRDLAEHRLHLPVLPGRPEQDPHVDLRGGHAGRRERGPEIGRASCGEECRWRGGPER